MRPSARSAWLPALGPVLVAVQILSPAAETRPRKWDLSMTLQVRGVYQVEERGSVYDGDLAFTLTWSGTMEEDDEDYRLVQRDLQLLEWEAHETTSAPSAARPKMTGDFPERPDFLHFYLMRDKSRCTVEFALRGLTVPVHETVDKAVLDLPRTAKSLGHESKVDYDAFIQEGTNLIHIPVTSLSRGVVEKKFFWSWKHKQWALGQERVVFLSNTHKVTVMVRVRPLSERR